MNVRYVSRWYTFAMKNSLLVVGVGALVIIIGLYAISISKSSKSNGESSRIMSSSLSLTSSEFENGASIPPRFTCDAENSSPPFSWGGMPEGAKSLALTMEDIDVPQQFNTGGRFVHWVLYGIPSDTKEIFVGKPVGVFGVNGLGKPTYTGPCPPREYEPSEHRYVITLYALNTELQFEAPPTKPDLLKAMEGHILGQSELRGTYKRVTQ